MATKKLKGKKYDPSFGSRSEWENEAENEIITLQEDIDELELPEESVLAIEKIVEKFKGRLNDCIREFSITPAMVAVQDKGVLLSDLLEEIYLNHISISESDVDQMVSIVEDNQAGTGGTFVKIENISQQMRLEQFLEDLYVNPFQLKLIA